MKPSTLLMQTGAAVAALALLGGCKEHGDATQAKTHFPGMVTAGGGTSGEVMAANSGNKTNAVYAGGTPGIAGGAGGNTSGAGTGGTTHETGQGPSEGVTPPSSAAAASAGANQNPSGDNKPAPAPTPAQAPAPEAAHRDPSHSAAPGR
jgi:hypothetical protein